MDIEEVLLKCNVMRENEEDIGLSDALLKIVKFAYYEEDIGLSDALLKIVKFAYYEGYNQNSIDQFLKRKTRGDVR